MKRLVFGLAAVSLSLVVTSASAGGLYFSDRGVRPMGRAGAFVAGADDLGAIWYNPAGIVDAGSSVLADFCQLRFSDSYTRTLRIEDADKTVRYVQSPEIRGSSPILPLPTLAISYAVDQEKRWVIAAGVLAPYVALASYPDRTDDGQASPARYTLGSFDGSLLALPGAWVAWKPSDKLRIGAGLLAMVGTFQSTITFSVCPQDRLICAPEQPEWDASSQMKVGPIVAPTGNGGLIYEPDPHVRIGVSGQLPMVVSSHATLKVKLPTSVALDGGRVTGDGAHVRFVLPGIFRAGLEIRPVTRDPKSSGGSDVRVELAWVHEFWSAHKTIEATPEGIFLENITGAPKSVAMPNISIPRNFKDSDSFRLGGEYSFLASGYRIALRTGISFETSAVPAEYMSLSSLDFQKTLLTIGGSLYIGKNWRFDAILGHMFVQDVDSDPNKAQIGRINPLSGNAPLEAVNGGHYHATADLIGCGLAYAY